MQIIIGIINVAVVLFVVALCAIGLKHLIDLWENKK